MKYLIPLSALFLFVGCATVGPKWTKVSRLDINGKAEKKKLYMDAMKKSDCAFIGDIKVTEPIHFTSVDPAEERRLASTDPEHINYYARGFDNSLRKKTMDMKGNMVITDFSQVGPVTKVVKGMAYNCPNL